MTKLNKKIIVFLVMNLVLLIAVIGCGRDDSPGQEAELNVSVSLGEVNNSEIEATINDKISKDELLVEVVNNEDESDSQTQSVELDDGLESLQFASLEVGATYTIEASIFEAGEESNQEFLIYQGEKEVSIAEGNNLVEVKTNLTEAEKLIISLSNLPDDFASGEITLEPNRYQADFSAADVSENEVTIEFEQLAADYYPINIKLDDEELDALNEIYALPGERVTRVEIDLDDDGESVKIEIDWQVAPDVPVLEGQSEDGNAKLSWDDIAHGYLLYRSVDLNDDYQLVQNDLITNNSYTDQDVIDGQTYYYKLRAYDEDLLASEISNEVSVTISDEPDDPEDPEKYTVTINDAVDGDGEPLSGVTIEYRSSDENEFTEVNSSSLTLEEGSYDFRASKEDYNTWSERIDLDSDTTIEPVLTESGSGELPFPEPASQFATNPEGQVGQYSTDISIDGSFAGWEEDMKIAQGAANTVAQSFRGGHEAPVYDTYALYAAWDDENLYLGWQFTNVVDVTNPGQDFPISDNGKPHNADIPQILAFDIDPNQNALGVMEDGETGVWAQDGKKFNTFDNNMDTLAMFSSQPGVGEPSIFHSTEEEKFSYDDEYVTGFREADVEFDYIDGLLPSIEEAGVYGVNKSCAEWDGYSPDDLLDDDQFEDLLAEGHDPEQDTFYEMRIPLEALGIDREYLESEGIGVMHVSTFGQSGIASMPYDPTVFENVTEEYSNDDSTSKEKEDLDLFTAPMPRVGNLD